VIGGGELHAASAGLDASEVVTEGGDAATLARGAADARGGPSWRAGAVGLSSGDVSTRSGTASWSCTSRRPPADRDRIAALLHRHQVHDVGYFGQARSSSSRPEYALTWVRAGAQPPPGLAPDRRDVAAPGPGDRGGESSGSV